MSRPRGVRMTLDAAGSLVSWSSSGIRLPALHLLPHKAFFSERGDESVDLLDDGVRSAFKAVSDLRHDLRKAPLAVEPLPYRHADGIGSHGIGRIGIEEHGPVVELLPENDDGIGDRPIRLLHGSFPPWRQRSRPPSPAKRMSPVNLERLFRSDPLALLPLSTRRNPPRRK